MPSAAPASSPNQTAIEVWSDVIAPKWLRFRHIVAAGMNSHCDFALERIPPPKGGRVLDLGCGTGESTLQLAGLVGDAGHVVGLDCAEPFLEVARREAAAARVTNVTYQLDDAQTVTFDVPFDFGFSRFGTMFFNNPVAALRNVRAALKPGATFAMLVWRKIQDNPWLGHSKSVALELLPPTRSDADTCGPGPFSMASADVTTDIMKAAGFERIALERFDHDVLMGNDIEEAVACMLKLGPAGEIVRVAGDLGQKQRPELERRLAKEFEQYQRADGIWGPSSSWLVSAKAPRA